MFTLTFTNLPIFLARKERIIIHAFIMALLTKRWSLLHVPRHERINKSLTCHKKDRHKSNSFDQTPFRIYDPVSQERPNLVMGASRDLNSITVPDRILKLMLANPNRRKSLEDRIYCGKNINRIVDSDLGHVIPLSL